MRNCGTQIKRAIYVYPPGMTKQDKAKVEVLLTEKVKAAFEAICADKGICVADGLRRAIEMWMEANK